MSGHNVSVKTNSTKVMVHFWKRDCLSVSTILWPLHSQGCTGEHWSQWPLWTHIK